MRHLILIVLLGVLSPSIFATNYVGGISTKINEISTYPSNGRTYAGDIRIIVDDPSNGCVSGFFMRNDTPGKADALSILLSAFHANKNVIIDSYSGVTWSASGSPDYCEVHSIRLTR